MRTTSFTLQPTPPFRLDLTAWALRRRANNQVDRWVGSTYQRVMNVDGNIIDVTVQQVAGLDNPELRVMLSGPSASKDATRAHVSHTLSRCLGLENDLSGFYRLADQDPLLAPIAERFRGLRPPRFATSIEALANAVSCQQLSLTVGIGLLNRLADAYGSVAPSGARAFPEAVDLAVVPGTELRSLGYSFRKGDVITALAREITSGTLDFDDLETRDDDYVASQLCQLYGIGRWSAEYVMLRGLGRTNVFPGDDVGARSKLRRWLTIDQPLDYAKVGSVVARWEPYAGLVYFHLLLDSLSADGWVADELALPRHDNGRELEEMRHAGEEQDHGDQNAGSCTPRLRGTGTGRRHAGAGRPHLASGLDERRGRSR